MWGRKDKTSQQKRCDKCGHFLTAPGAAWTTKANAQRFEGDGAAALRQTWPTPTIKTPRTRSKTKARLQQSLALGACCSACILPIALVYPGGAVLAAGTMLFTTTSTYVLSVALGKENQEALFNLLDRNRDGKLNRKDLHHAVNAILDEVLEPDKEQTPQLQSTTDNIVYGLHVTRRMPDRKIVLAVILPEYPSYNVKEKMRQCARLYFELDGNENFSKRQCGEPFGDDINQAQVELEKLGYITKRGKAKNAPRKWTPEGERWLKGFLPSPTP